MLEFLRKAVLLGAGLTAVTTEKIEEVVQEIVKKGDITEKEGKELVGDLVERSRKMKKEWIIKIEKTIQKTLRKLNLPTRQELEGLKTRLEKLEKEREKKE